MPKVENISSLIKQSCVSSEVIAALDDDPRRAGIITEACPDALVGSKLFNGVTAAYCALRRNPNNKLLTKKIEHPKDSITQVEVRALVDALNVGHVAVKAAYQFTSKNPAPSKGTCPQAEFRFLEFLEQDYLEPDQTPSTLFVDKYGTTVFFQKHEGEPSALSFKQTVVNGIKLPHGTLLSLEETDGLPNVEVDNFRVVPANNTSFQHIAPLRLSAYAIEPNKRAKALTSPVEAYHLEGNDELINDLPRFVELQSYLPPKEELAGAYKAFQRQS